MGILLALLAGLFTPLTNLTVRKSIDWKGTSLGYFVFQMLFSLLFSLFLGPIARGDFSPSTPALSLGVLAGIVLFCMLFFVGKAVEKGPSGFTFAVLNSATVMPGLIMALLFGSGFGYAYNFWHAVGSVLVLLGLFWGVQGIKEVQEKKKWLIFVAAMFFFHLLLLTLYQYRALLLSPLRSPEIFAFFPKEEMNSEWFTPAMFFTALLLQFFSFLRLREGKISRKEILYGFSGGFTNLLSTNLLLFAAIKAAPLENAVIFPIFSVVSIVLTNVWGQKLYRENINWRACQISVLGLMIGSVDWKGVAAAIGL